MATTRRSLLRYLPPLIAVAALIYLFGFHIDIEDRHHSGHVESVDVEQRIVTLETEEGEQRIPFNNVVELRSLDGVWAETPEHAQSHNVTYVRYGLLHFLEVLGWKTGLLVGLTIALGLLIQVFRLRLLLLSNNHSLTSVAKATLIGLFYGNVIPAGQVGGDPVKALYLSHWLKVSRATTLAAVMMDRMIGLAVLAAIAAVALVFSVSVSQTTTIVVLGLLGGLSLGLIALLSHRVRRTLGISWLGERLPFKGPLQGFIDALSVYKEHRGKLVGAAFLSLGAHACLVGAVGIVGVAIGLKDIGVELYALLVPLANIVSSVPGAPPGGWGVGEGAFVVLFGTYGVLPEAAIILSIVPRVWMMLLSLIGFPAAVMNRGTASAALPQVTPESEEEAGKQAAASDI